MTDMADVNIINTVVHVHNMRNMHNALTGAPATSAIFTFRI